MKISEKVAILLALSILFVGCAIPNYPSVCDTAPADSWICQKANEMGVDVEQIDLLLQASSLRFLDGDNRQKALSFFDSAERVLNTEISYQQLVWFVQDRVKLTGPEVLIISMYLPRFSATFPISEYDKMLISAHIEHQRAILK